MVLFKQETQTSNVERLIAWLLDHSNIEVPELESTQKETQPAPTTPPPPKQKKQQQQPPASGNNGEAVMVYESSSESSDGSDLDESDNDGTCSTLFLPLPSPVHRTSLIE